MIVAGVSVALVAGVVLVVTMLYMTGWVDGDDITNPFGLFGDDDDDSGKTTNNAAASSATGSGSDSTSGTDASRAADNLLLQANGSANGTGVNSTDAGSGTASDPTGTPADATETVGADVGWNVDIAFGESAANAAGGAASSGNSVVSRMLEQLRDEMLEKVTRNQGQGQSSQSKKSKKSNSRSKKSKSNSKKRKLTHRSAASFQAGTGAHARLLKIAAAGQAST